MDTAQALSPDTVIGQRYVILAVEDHDGHCWHYRGRDTDGQAIVDIVEFFPEGVAARAPEGSVAAADEDPAGRYHSMYEQFRARAQALAALTEPGLSSVRQPIEERNTVYAIVEPVDGPSLAAWAAGLGRPPTQLEIDALLGPLLDAMAALHDAGFLHLAITPETIVLRHGRKPVLTRILANAPRAAEGANSAANSAPWPYQAPELVAADTAKLGPRSDIYALAGVIYSMLTGKPPSRSAGAAGETWIPPVIQTATADFRPEFLQGVATSLAPQPSQRPPTIAALKSLLLEEPPHELSTDERAAERPQTESRRERHAAAPSGLQAPNRPLDRRVPWLAIAALGGVVLIGVSYLGLRPTLAPPGKVIPIPATMTAENARTPSESPAQLLVRELVQPPPIPERQETVEIPPVPAANQERPVVAGSAQETLQSIATETDPRALLRIAEQAPALRNAAEERLLALGFLHLKSFDKTSWVRPGDGESFQECANCPDMIALPAGTFRMGSPSTEAGRQEDEDDTAGPGGNPVTVTIAQPFAIGRFEITVGQFAAFVQDTGYKMAAGCYIREGGRQFRPELSWTAPGFAQDASHPVACVSWEDADTYVQWLSTKTGNTYRLLTEAEWEYAARGGSATRFAYGNEDAGICEYGNSADQTASAAFPDWVVAPCQDGFRYTAPVGSFKPNKFGLYDMHGNVWEWVEDCQSDSLRHLLSAYAGASPACAPNTPRILRGGSWSDPPERIRSAARIAGPPAARDQIVGFRVGRSLETGK